jgi:hypothetical protein
MILIDNFLLEKVLVGQPNLKITILNHFPLNNK